MDLPLLVRKGPISTDELKVIHEPSNRMVHEELEIQANMRWEQIQKAAKNTGIRLWDSVVYRLNNIDEVSKGSNTLKLSEINYGQLRGYIELTQEGIELTPSQMPLHMATWALCRTLDGKWMFGKRSNNVSSPGKIMVIGGSLSKSESIVETGNDIKDNMIREIEEETFIKLSGIERCDICGIAISAHMTVGIVYDVLLNMTEDEISNNFKQQENFEIKELIFLDSLDEIVDLTDDAAYLKMYRDMAKEMLGLA